MVMTKLYNLEILKSRRRVLRRNPPSPEIIVWNTVRNRQIDGCKFKRQYSVGRFVIDFSVPNLKLAVEIDGDTHYKESEQEKDRHRQQYLEKLGIKFLRFTNQDINENLNGVVERIREYIQTAV